MYFISEKPYSPPSYSKKAPRYTLQGYKKTGNSRHAVARLYFALDFRFILPAA
ncbi:hypothetical protein SAMN05421739_10857 [Pontibacter chinhatensis]|uniref:Uncharacterized protein n=1 Tax=Pontibacter chinhatensis TaxID=1436961 RepID=A0A1I2YG05_9BACT|nr:hypothetical protein SAMN05421739_10857 [Pontibacter chinhatensis]